tara:strand:- start:853 stop:2997 length:2145 start_codon:yes stop_codon:yes gene_type:complete
LLNFCTYLCSSTTFLTQEFLLFNNLKAYAGNNYEKIIVESFNIPRNYKYDKDFSLLIKTLANLIDDKKENSQNNKNFLEIESDTKIMVGDKFIAEGNVSTISGSAKIMADRFVYDQINRIFLIEGNIKFFNGEQYFQASKLYFDAIKDEGYVEDIYGVLSFESFSEDLKIDSINNKKVVIDQYQKYEQGEINILRPSTLGFNKKEKNISLINEDIKKWRFKSKKIIFNSRSMSSDEVFFTNDVFNKPQLILQTKDFSAEIIDKNMQFKSKKSFFLFENKFKIPAGRRNISTASNDENIWGIGYEYNDKDGYYLKQNLSPYNIFPNFEIDLDVFYLFNRALNGKTRSFRAKNSSVTDENISVDSLFLDYFGLDANVKGKLNKFDFYSLTEFSSLDFEKIDKASRSKLQLIRTFNLSNNKKINFNANSNSSSETLSDDNNNLFKIDEINNYKNIYHTKEPIRELDLSFYASYREKINKPFSETTEDLHTSYGTMIALKTNNNLNNRTNESKLIVLDFGLYQAEKKDIKQLDDLFRIGILGKLSYEIDLIDFGEKKSLTREYFYIPTTINQGIDINFEATANLFQYSNSSSQEAVSFALGPKLTLGELKKNYFDYSMFSLNYVYINGTENSPFKFDNIEDSSKLVFDYEQQLFGPLLLGYKAEVDLYDKGNITSGKYKIAIKRRAYSLEGYYEPENKKGGFNFLINNFRYKGIPKSF